MKRIIDAIRRWWYGDNHGVHARPRRQVEFIEPITGMVIPRKQVSGRPPWETAPLPVPAVPVCLIPAYDPPQLHPVVQAAIKDTFGVESISEYVTVRWAPLWEAVWSAA